MEVISREMEAYLDDLRMRMASSMVDVEADPMLPETIMLLSRKNKFPCPSDGKYVTTSECWDCSRSQQCDIYATMLDEDFT